MLKKNTPNGSYNTVLKILKCYVVSKYVCSYNNIAENPSFRKTHSKKIKKFMNSNYKKIHDKPEKATSSGKTRHREQLVNEMAQTR